MGEDSFSWLHYIIIALQIFFFIFVAIIRKHYPEAYDRFVRTYLLFEDLSQEDEFKETSYLD